MCCGLSFTCLCGHHIPEASSCCNRIKWVTGHQNELCIFGVGVNPGDTGVNHLTVSNAEADPLSGTELKAHDVAWTESLQKSKMRIAMAGQDNDSRLPDLHTR